MRRILNYLNPVARLGLKKYSFFFSLSFMIATSLLSEVYAYRVANNPMVVGTYAIFIYFALIIYFSFRDGKKGGFVATTIALIYYLFIIYSRNYVGDQFIAGLRTTLFLGLLYYLLAATIGGLKEKIDVLIEKEADEKRRLKAIVQQLPVGVVIANKKGIVELANSQLEEILGTSVPVGLSLNKKSSKRTSRQKQTLNDTQNFLLETISQNKVVVGKEYVIKRKNGNKIHISVNTSPIHNKSGQVIAVAGIVSNITLNKEAEARKDDFVNMASHELKTPLTSMKLYVETLGKRLEMLNDATAIKTLGRVKDQTKRLQKLVSDLLDVSRLQTGKLTFTKEPLDINDLVSETAKEFSISFPKKPFHFNLKKQIFVDADKFRIYQVLSNLLTNAIKYSSPNTPIKIAVNRNKKDVLVSVKDSGIGIDKGQQKRIFERLYQVTDGKENTFPGLGMGLYISKEIIKRHHGRIWVESKKGKGSTFYFSLPLVKKL